MWKDIIGSNRHEEGMEAVDLGAGLEPGIVGYGKGLESNCYIVAGLFYFIWFGVCFNLLGQKVKGWGAAEIRGE